MIEFSTSTSNQQAAALTTLGDVAAAVQYISENRSTIDAEISGDAGEILFFNANIANDGWHTYILILGTGGGAGYQVGIGSDGKGDGDSVWIDLAGVNGTPNINGGVLYVQSNATPPTVVITDNISGTAKSGDIVTFTFTFSEAVTGFTANSITIGN